MKRLMILLVAVLILLTGCSGKTETPIELSEKTDNSGMRTIFYTDGKQCVPLSIAVDGARQIENGVYWHYELMDRCDFESETVFCLYDAETKNPIKRVPYKNLNDESGFALNGEWQAFYSMLHTEYGKDNQDDVDEKLKLTTRQLLDANKMEKAEVTVTDVWNYDLDGDAVEEQFFKACNCGISDEEQAYCILGYVDGEVCQTLYGGYATKTGDDENARKLEPIICDSEGNGTRSVWLYKSSDYRSVTSFDFNNGNFSRNYEIIF